MKLSEWVQATPKLSEWMTRLAKRSVATSELYVSQLFNYWKHHLSGKFKTLEEWVGRTKEEGRAEDYEIQTRWARDLEEFLYTYVSKRTGRPLSTEARGVCFWAVKNYLAFRLGEKNLSDYEPIFADRKHIFEEREKQQDTATVTLDEVKKLVLASNTRDRAIILCSVWGLGVGEFLVFAQDWFKYVEGIRNKSTPLKVSMTRGKTGIRFYAKFWDDALDALNDLLAERERESGRSLTKDDALFVHNKGSRYQKRTFSRRFATWQRQPGSKRVIRVETFGRSYRVRPHEIGRDMFATVARNKGIPDHICKFCMGHQVDPLKYEKQPWTDEGEGIVTKELQKIRPFLNLLTHRGEVEAGQSYFEQTVETIAISKGLDPEYVKGKLIFYAAELPAIRAELAKTKAEGVIEEILENILMQKSRKELLPAVIQLSKDLNEGAKPKMHQEVIDETEVPQYLKKGWKFVSTFTATHAIVEIEEEKSKKLAQ